MFDDINSSQNINASSYTAYAVNNPNLKTGEYLTVKGNANDSVVANVFGLASISIGSGAGILLQGGILAKNFILIL